MLHRHRPAQGLLIATGLLLQGCQPPMPSPSNPHAPATVRAHGPDVPTTDANAAEGTATAWPLRFTAHNFGAHCFDTQSCEILYRGFTHGSEAPSPSVSSYGRPLDELLSAGRGPIPNFPPPARVTWRSKDGTTLSAEIDFSEIFGDELIRHNVVRQDISTSSSIPPPDIIVEIDDRTVHVYMRAFIALKHPVSSERPHSNYRDDLIEVYSRTY